MERQRVVIVGAGFGGLTCARSLIGGPVDVTLIDRHNYHLFTPLLYQVASSLLNPSDIAIPVRTVFRRAKNVRVVLADVTGVDLDGRAVLTGTGLRIPYDRLVLAVGSTTNFFGMEEMAGSALGLKDLEEALELRNHVLTCFEAAARTSSEDERRQWMTFVVVGGGPTGVEYAGALSELVRLVLVEDFPELDMHRVRIALVELLPRLLAPFDEDLSEYAREELTERRVDVRVGTRLVAARGDAVELTGGEVLPTKTLVWAAGVKPAELAFAIDVPRRTSGRVAVDGHLRVEGRSEVHAIGDMASFLQDGEELPMTAPPAMQQARHTARSILCEIRGRPLKPFRYRDKGIMATIGRKAAVAQAGAIGLKGFLGWVAWLLLHIYYIIGFRNRLLVLLGWAWEYFHYDRPVRLIARARSPARPAGELAPEGATRQDR